MWGLVGDTFHPSVPSTNVHGGPALPQVLGRQWAPRRGWWPDSKGTQGPLQGNRDPATGRGGRGCKEARPEDWMEALERGRRRGGKVQALCDGEEGRAGRAGGVGGTQPVSGGGGVGGAAAALHSHCRRLQRHPWGARHGSGGS